MSDTLREAALAYHKGKKPGKLEIKATKPMANQRDLALAYSPGVAHACEAIEENPLCAADYTARSNLVAVVSNGTAVLGLGAIGPLASKPVMEGKAVLFKKFADIDVFDLEVDELDPQKFIDTVARLEPSFGGVNLEDIKAPECFIIEEGLKERMQIPVFHDDQHGTAIVVSSAIINGLELVGKQIGEVKLVTAGAGAAALACLNLLLDLGLKRENVIVCDIAGVVYEGRTEEMDPYKAKFANATDARTLQQALQGADVFLGLSAAGVLQADWLPAMAENPLIMALANPTPEILPEQAREVRADAIIATGRSDYPNQVNNVLCFPFLFRGALDVGATEINAEMKMACVRAIAGLARKQASDTVREAYGGQALQFGPDYLIPKPFDKRLMEEVPIAVAKAAMETGVARLPQDLEAYAASLQHQVFRTSMALRSVFEAARVNRKRVVYAEGENDKVIQVAQQVVDQGVGHPILLGRSGVIEGKIAEFGLTLRPGVDVDIVDPSTDPRHRSYREDAFNLLGREGYSPGDVNDALRQQPSVFAAMMLRSGDADAMICGSVGRYNYNVKVIERIVGLADNATRLTSMNGLVLDKGTYFISDAYVQQDPKAQEIAEITCLGAESMRAFGIEPRVALLSHSNFGSGNTASAEKMRQAYRILQETRDDLVVEGEMHADYALSRSIREIRMPGSRLAESANLLIMPNQDAANIAYNMLKVLADGFAIGPILLGTAQSAHVVTPSVTVRGLLNMTALAAVRAASNLEHV